MATEKKTPAEDRAATQEWLETILEGYYSKSHPQDNIVPEVRVFYLILFLKCLDFSNPLIEIKSFMILDIKCLALVTS